MSQSDNENFEFVTMETRCFPPIEIVNAGFENGSSNYTLEANEESTESSSEDEEDIQDMNDAILQLQKVLLMKYSVDIRNEISKADAENKRQQILNRIEIIYLDIVTSLLKNVTPKLLIRNHRTWDNTTYTSMITLRPIGEASNTEVNFSNSGSRNKFGMIIFILGKIYKLLSTRTFCTKREMFYQNLEKIQVQSQLDNILNDIMCLLDTSLHELNIYASSKGLVYGPLEIITENSVINCNIPGGTTIPYNVYDIKKVNCDACLILLIEKDAVFQKLISENIQKGLGPCLLITGKGFPDMNTRYLLKFIWDTLAIPIFALVDPDPWGIEIMCTYRYGSLTMAHQSNLLAVPSIRWIGIHPSEIEKFYNTNEPLTQKDRSKLEDLLNRSYIKDDPQLRDEIQILLDKNYKAEIEGVEMTPSYLTKLYIRHKITHHEIL